MLRLHPSGFYAWLANGLSARARRNRYLSGLIKQSWLESGCVYGYRKIHHDLLDLGQSCSPNRVARLMQAAGLKAQTGYKRRSGHHGRKPHVVVYKQLAQNFDVKAPDQAWVTDITYIRTHEG